MRRILRFSHFNFKEKRAFGSINLNKIYTWVDASYAVNIDINSQTGCAMYMRLGITNCRYSKQKLNTKISTESELVGADDRMVDALWTNSYSKGKLYSNKKQLFDKKTRALYCWIRSEK